MRRCKNWHNLGILVLLAFLAVCSPSRSQASGSIALSPLPTPTPDRLAEPALPENPTQYEQGRHVYWLNCMPCHGDVGQGLTDEFRRLWVDDHQDCWESGCHGGRAKDEGFMALSNWHITADYDRRCHHNVQSLFTCKGMKLMIFPLPTGYTYDKVILEGF